jgi:hypothetical protein
MKGTWTVAVVYENAEIREAAVAFCDSLAEKFWSQLGFDVSWWSFSLLGNPGASAEALKSAAGANFIVFASAADSELPEHVRNWVEQWVLFRGEKEGALIGLPVSAGAEPAGSIQIHLYLRDVAHRAGMDYLTDVPQYIGQPIPDSPQFLAERADKVSSVLDEILHQRPPGPQLP